MAEIFDETVKQRIFQQIMDIFIIPEINRRRENGTIQDGTVITKMQIVFNLDKGRSAIRLNDEVKAILEIKPNRGIRKGEAVYERDIDSIEEVKLTDEDVNCGHFTLLLFRNHWIVSFDFRYNKNRVKTHIGASKEFYETAIYSLDNDRLRAFYENAFASAELSATSILLTIPSKELLDCRVHKKRLSQFKDWADLGNVKMEFSTTLSELSELRDSARYLHSDKYKESNPHKIKEIVKEMIVFAEDSIK